MGTLPKALAALAPTGMLFLGSLLSFLKSKAPGSLLQLIGTASLMVMVLTHICEALHLFPGMHWGLEHSVGHYLDLLTAAMGVTLFPIGFLWSSLQTERIGAD